MRRLLLALLLAMTVALTGAAVAVALAPGDQVRYVTGTTSRTGLLLVQTPTVDLIARGTALPSSTQDAVSPSVVQPVATPTPTPIPTPTATPTPTPTPPATSAWPDASNTGVPAGTTLTAYTGPTTITVNNTIIDSKDIVACLTIKASGVIIRKTRIRCNTSTNFIAVYMPDGPAPAVNLLIEDTEVDGQLTGGHCVSEAYVTIRRANIHGCENGMDINQEVLIEDSYVHDLCCGNNPDAHADALQTACGHWVGSGSACGASGYANGARNVTIRHNTLYGAHSDGSMGTSAIHPDAATGNTNILVDNNVLAGGAVPLYCQGPGTATNWQNVNNHFSKIFRPNYGEYGISSNCSDEINAGNVDHETGLPVTLD